MCKLKGNKLKKLEIKKEDLIYNLNLIRNRLNGKSGIMAVVKANGMGLGLVKFVKFLSEQGISFFAVATPEEALGLRQAGISEDILMMSEIVNQNELKSLIENDVIITIGSIEEKQKAEEIAIELEKQARAHVKIDTGFSRYGFLWNDEQIFKAVKSNYNIKIEGCFTHFSKPVDETWTIHQFSRLKRLIPDIREINPEIKFHCCNSTAFLKYEDMWLDYVRLGSCLQGRVLDNTLGLKKVGELKAEIVTIKYIRKGYNISYSNEYIAKRDMRIAVVNSGYIDGFNLKKDIDSFSLKTRIIDALVGIKKIFIKDCLKVKIVGKSFKVVRKTWNVSCSC